jgi:hypothetical protein
MKQTAVEKLAIAFRQWQTDWDNFDKTGKNQPAPYDEFIAPFLEMEKQQKVETWSEAIDYSIMFLKDKTSKTSKEAFDEHYELTYGGNK